MKVFIEREKGTREVEANTVKELLEKLQINETTVLVVRNNTLITNDTKLDTNDEIKLLSVISGG